MHKALLISVRSKYARAILAGFKTVELRRVRPSIERGSTVYLYETAPVQQIHGYFVVEKVISAAPKQLWKLCGHNSGITREEFERYFLGCKTGYGIVIATSSVLRVPLSRSTLKKHYTRFHPPQSYLYLRGENRLTQLLTEHRTAA